MSTFIKWFTLKLSSIYCHECGIGSYIINGNRWGKVWEPLTLWILHIGPRHCPYLRCKIMESLMLLGTMMASGDARLMFSWSSLRIGIHFPWRFTGRKKGKHKVKLSFQNLMVLQTAIYRHSLFAVSSGADIYPTWQ